MSILPFTAHPVPMASSAADGYMTSIIRYYTHSMVTAKDHIYGHLNLHIVKVSPPFTLPIALMNYSPATFNSIGVVCGSERSSPAGPATAAVPASPQSPLFCPAGNFGNTP